MGLFSVNNEGAVDRVPEHLQEEAWQDPLLPGWSVTGAVYSDPH